MNDTLVHIEILSSLEKDLKSLGFHFDTFVEGESFPAYCLLSVFYKNWTSLRSMLTVTISIKEDMLLVASTILDTGHPWESQTNYLESFSLANPYHDDFSRYLTKITTFQTPEIKQWLKTNGCQVS